MCLYKNVSLKKLAGAVILSALVLFGCDGIGGLMGGGNAFAPTKEGMVLTTIQRDGDGNISGATRTTVKSVNRSGKNMTITTVQQVFDAKGDVTNTFEETTNVVDGVTEIDIGDWIATMRGLPRSAAGGSGILRLPSNMKAGELFGDIRLDVDGFNVSITNIRCATIEEITVAADRFSNAYKMIYNIGVNRVGARGQQENIITATVTEWYVKGVGVVKSEVVHDNGTTVETAELVGLERDGKPSENRLVIDVTPTDGGMVSRSLEQDVYAVGTIVTLTAEPARGYMFKEWAGAVSGNTKTIIVAVVGDVNVEAVFEKLTDSRDGKTYGVVQMPDGKLWMAENLNYVPESGNSWCYDDNESNCERYGRLYDWNTALTACPVGWRVPDYDEWDELLYDVDRSRISANRFKSQSDWSNDGNGTDDFGFSALPGGLYSSASGFDDIADVGVWWSARSPQTQNITRGFGMRHDSEAVFLLSNNSGDNIVGFSVRCIFGDRTTPLPRAQSQRTQSNRQMSPTKSRGAINPQQRGVPTLLSGSRSMASIRRDVMRNMGALRHAYNRRLRERPNLRGTITITFSINASGQVTNATMESATTNDAQLERIVLDRVRNFNFEQIDIPGDVTTVTYPFAFTP